MGTDTRTHGAAVPGAGASAHSVDVSGLRGEGEVAPAASICEIRVFLRSLPSLRRNQARDRYPSSREIWRAASTTWGATSRMRSRVRR